MKKIRNRNYYGVMSSIISVGCNLVLFASKLIVGLLFSSIATVADAFNNLSDLGSNAVSLVGFKISSIPADKQHPFGHARAEYISALVVSFIVLFLGGQLLITAIEKIINPVPTQFSIVTIIVLVLSIVVKFGMFAYNKTMGKKISSPVLKATAVDSLADCISTTAVLIAMVITYFTNVDLDAYMTILIALVIIFAGFKIAKEIMSKLIGEAPTQEFVKSVKQRILAHEGVLGVHDLVVHSYGYNKTFVSAHVEVDSSKPILSSHDIIDNIELSFAPEITMVIHLDPIVIDDPLVNQLRQKVEEIVNKMDGNLSMHDFRVVFGTTHSNLIFDLVIPFECKTKLETIKQEIIDKVSPLGNNYLVHINVDRE
ncbi:MAG: cation diffusion facilitator family transporter [Clostridia bacterium]